MTGLVSELFSLVTSEELPIVTHFVMGEVFPAWTDEEVGLGTGILINALSRSSGLSVKEIEDIVRETGDIGKTTVKALGKVSKGQATFSSFLDSPAELSIMEVFERFRDIAHATGKGSQTSKIKHLQYLFNSASVEEVSGISARGLGDATRSAAPNHLLAPQIETTCWYSGTTTSACGLSSRNVSANARHCDSSPWMTVIFLISPVNAST